MRSSDGSLIVADIPKAKYRFHVAAILLYRYKTFRSGSLV